MSASQPSGSRSGASAAFSSQHNNRASVDSRSQLAAQDLRQQKGTKRQATASNVANAFNVDIKRRRLRQIIDEDESNKVCRVTREVIVIEDGSETEETPQTHFSMPTNNRPDSSIPVNESSTLSQGISPTFGNIKAPAQKENLPKRTAPDEETLKLYSKWQALIPTLRDDYLYYTSMSKGKVIQPVGAKIIGVCDCHMNSCKSRVAEITCLYYDHFTNVQVTWFTCRTLSQLLVRHGLFPTAPDQPRMAFSIDFLDFYASIFQRSFDAVNAMAAALNMFYKYRGYHLLNSEGEIYKDPFRRGLGYAAQWYDQLKILIESHLQAIINEADQNLQNYLKSNAQDKKAFVLPKCLPQLLKNTKILDPHKVVEEINLKNIPECARQLRQLCPACFGGKSFGKSLSIGGDFQISTDGNFHHKHLKSGGQGAHFYEPKFFIPENFVDEVGRMIEIARKKKPKKAISKVPESAILECQESHEAANGETKVQNNICCCAGHMSLICRHDIPIFFANINTPGEQQKYPIALILWLFQFIPSNATATVLYDIACVLHRSIELFEILPLSIQSRIQFATTAMHAYGHQWSCQLEYNPRFIQGLGLTDGEGVERTWSRLHKLIVIVRSSSGTRRIWITDRQLDAISKDLRDSLGDWISHRYNHGIKNHLSKAKQKLITSAISLDELNTQWNIQKNAQLTCNQKANLNSKKKLDAILKLQANADAIESTIQSTKSILSNSSNPIKSNNYLEGLVAVQKQLLESIEDLYSSLDINESFPNLQGTNLEFVKKLIIAKETKAIIRKMAVGSFFEMDRLDQASEGKHQPLGTRLHQNTKKAIIRRSKTLTAAIKKFNCLFQQMAEIYNPQWEIPLPEPLSFSLTDLKDPDKSNLWEDIWTDASFDVNQPWLKDPNTRLGIKAMLKMKRCDEEQTRLAWEGENLSYWYGRELAALEFAIQIPAYQQFIVNLTHQRDYMLQQKYRWINPFTSKQELLDHVKNAVNLARKLTGNTAAYSVSAIFLNPSILDTDIEYQEDKLDAEQNFLDQETLSDELSSDFGQDFQIVDEDTSYLPSHYEDTLLIQDKNDTINITNMDNDIIVFTENTSSNPLLKPSINETLPGKAYLFQANELKILQSKKGKLNDMCINGLAAIIQHTLSQAPEYSSSSSNHALFTTFDMHRIHYKVQDIDLWRNTKSLQFWSKNIWIIPIHRPEQEHWVLAVLCIDTSRIFFYDSLAQNTLWQKDTQDLMVLVTRLTELAKRYGYSMNTPHKPWKAEYTPNSPVQTNNWDCGLWVLLWITATIRGYALLPTTVNEATILKWRIVLSKLVKNIV